MNGIPDDWSSDRLKDVAQINGASLPANTNPDYEFDYLEISNVNYYGVIDPAAIEHLRFEDAPTRARRRVGKNSTIVSSVRPNLQAIAFMPDSHNGLVCSTGFNVVQPHERKLLPKFVYYALLSERGRQYFEAAGKGVGYPAVDDKDFGSFSMLLPPLSEQQRIAAFLDTSCASIDAAVEVKRRQIVALEDVRESLIASAVTRGIRPGVKMRGVNEEWVADVPAHWDVRRIKRVVSRIDYGISESTEPEGRYPVLKMGHIQHGEIAFRDLDYVDEVEENLLLDRGDLLYNRTNSPDQVGKAAVFRGSKADEVTFASYLVRLRTNHLADPFYLNYLVNSSGFLSFARKLAIPSVQQSNLNSTRYSRMLVPVPPIAEQREIAEYLDVKMAELARIVTAIEGQISVLRTYRKSLIHEYVTGVRRLSEDGVAKATAHG